MRFTDRPKWKTIVIMVICLIGLLAAIGGSFAAYTNSQAFQRGVARNRDTETVRFTSNYLQACASGTDSSAYAGRTVLFSEGVTGELSVDIYVYNYANGNENLVSQKDIIYDLKIQLSNGKEGSTYTVSVDDGAGESVTNGLFEKSSIRLAGRNASSHKYTIKFSAADLDTLRIIATATPTGSSLSATNNQKLAAVIAPCVGSSTNAFSYSSQFIDQTASNNPKEFDGFNYEVSISSGIADATITWDTTMVEIDKYFLINLGKTNEDIAGILSTGKLEFVMNQTEGTGDYLIPFYIKDKDKIPTNWNQMRISFKAVSRDQSVTESDAS